VKQGSRGASEGAVESTAPKFVILSKTQEKKREGEYPKRKSGKASPETDTRFGKKSQDWSWNRDAVERGRSIQDEKGRIKQIKQQREEKREI